MKRNCDLNCDVDGGIARREREEAERLHDLETHDAWVRTFFEEEIEDIEWEASQ